MDGTLRRGLVTLPCPSFWSEATVALESDLAGRLTVRPGWKTKALRAVALTLNELGVANVGGTVSIASNIAPGRGCGSSTSDVAAAVRATLGALRRSRSPERIASLAVAAEGASDATFWERPVLFAQRDGDMIQDYKLPLPPIEVLAFETGDGAGIDTLALPAPRYRGWEIDRFDELRAALGLALARSDARGVAAVATESARINQRHLSQPRFDEITALAGRAGALGVQVAHSGEVGGLLFARAPSLEWSIRRAHDELASMGLKPWRFSPHERAGHESEPPHAHRRSRSSRRSQAR